VSRYLDIAGTFKAKPTEWSVKQIPNGNVAISVVFETLEMRDGDAWKPTDRRTVRGDFFTLKQTGAPNEKVVAMLCQTLGWGGSFEQVHREQPFDVTVQIDVEERTYNGKSYFDAKWIRAEDAEPRGAAMSPDDVAALDKRHAEGLKAIAAKVKREQPKPQDEDKPAGEPTDYGDIPFGWLLALPLLGVLF
jgi:hypothetical protein